MQFFKQFSYQLLIREKHLDTFGHVNNATYLEILEEARWEFLAREGIGLKQIQAAGIGPVILECHIKFLKELVLRQLIRVESQMQSFEKKTGQMKQSIYNEAGELSAEAVLIFGVFDLKQRKLVLPDSGWLVALGLCERH